MNPMPCFVSIHGSYISTYTLDVFAYSYWLEFAQELIVKIIQKL